MHYFLIKGTFLGYRFLYQNDKTIQNFFVPLLTFELLTKMFLSSSKELRNYNCVYHKNMWKHKHHSEVLFLHLRETRNAL